MTSTPEKTDRSLFIPRSARILSVAELTPQEKLFRVELSDDSDLGHLPGQFVQISILGLGEAPISVASSPTRRGYFELGVRLAGSLTGGLHRLRAGDTFGIRGPYGRPFDLPRLRGKDLLLISGGCGLAPMRSLIQYCQDRPDDFGRVTILYGAKNPEAVLFKEEIGVWEASERYACAVTVDQVPDGSCHDGPVGQVTRLIPPLQIEPSRTVAAVVGPPAMYRCVIDELKRKGLREDQIAVSLERQMRCGVGKCGHCTIEHLYCCLDGPVFWLDEVSGVRGALCKTLTTCPYCGTGCAFYLLADDAGRLVGVEPSVTHPVSRGRLCVKGWNAHAFVHHPERLTTPLVRRHRRLEAASWEEALERTAEGLRRIARRHGPDALMFFSSAKATNEENYLMMKLARAGFGTNNVDHCARLCHSSTVVGLAATLGSGAMTNSVACIDEADVILVTGSNTTEQHPLIGARILEAAQRGAALIVADNRRIRLARSADLHLRHRNGSDVALLNGMMHVILREGLENRDFIAARTEESEALRKNLESWTPEQAAAATGLSPGEIVAAARLFASGAKGMIIYSMGITQHTHGVDNVRAIADLALLTGNIGRSGTGVNPLRGQNNVQGACDMGALPNVFTGYQPVADAAVRGRFAAAWGVAELPAKPGLMATVAMNAAADGQVRGGYILGENPMLSDPDQAHVRRALQRLDFLVVQDLFLSETAELADVVLPAACFAEKDGTFTSTERRVQRVRQATQPPGSARADWRILCALGERIGCPGMDYADPKQIMAEIASLTPSYGGIDYGRIDILGLQWPCPEPSHPGTPVLHVDVCSRGRGRFAPVDFRPPAEEPDADYPFILTTGRTVFHWHTGTMTRRTHLLDREERSPFVEIHPADAGKLGVRQRQTVLVATRRGAVPAAARVTDMVEPGVLFMPFHFAEGAANALTHNVLDPEAGIPEYKVCAARLEILP